MKLSLSSKLAILLFCLLKLALHLKADVHSGFQGDELLHIETGNHLAFGYMEFPPVIGLLAFLQNLFQSPSVFIHHVFAHIASLLILIYVAKTIRELGGGTRAIILALLCILIAPGFGRSQQLFQPVVFSQLFWVLSFYQLARYVIYRDGKFLWYLTFTAAVAMLTKYDAVFFLFGLFSLFFFQSTRNSLIKHKFWMNLLVFLLLVSPNVMWQAMHDFPALNMFSRLYETQLDYLRPAEVIGRLILSLNPLSLLILIPGIAFMFYKPLKEFRPLALSILLSALFLSLSQGKAYYFFPLMLTILPFGAIYWERLTFKGKRWPFYPATLILIPGALLIPFGMPVFSLESYIQHEYPYEQETVAGGQYAIKFEERYSKSKWRETLQALKSVYETLPQQERQNCLIWGKHYGQAGAVALFGKQHQLPEAFSLHGSFYNWLPKGDMPNTLIAFRYSKEEGKDFFEPFFEEVTPVKSIYNPYAAEPDELWQTIFICKKPKQDFAELKLLFADRVFE